LPTLALLQPRKNMVYPETVAA